MSILNSFNLDTAFENNPLIDGIGTEHPKVRLPIDIFYEMLRNYEPGLNPPHSRFWRPAYGGGRDYDLPDFNSSFNKMVTEGPFYKNLTLGEAGWYMNLRLDLQPKRGEDGQYYYVATPERTCEEWEDPRSADGERERKIHYVHARSLSKLDKRWLLPER